MANPDIDLHQLLPQGATLQNGKYRVVRYLSSGNFGNTYIVENTGMQVEFAMKEFFLRNICYRTGGAGMSVSPAVSPEKVAVQREKFKKEARRLYGLSSKHLVHVNDMFEENSTVYYVMDFVKGESLSNYMQRTGQPLSEEQALFVFNQLLDGLEEVHSKQIWHLDLKPENLMIDKDGNVVIIDFGASKQVGQSGKYTGTSNILCYTPGYAPSEQVNQNMAAIGPWTDIYALGATLYNLLTGIDPSTVNPAAPLFPKTVSARMKQLVRRLMNIDMKQRPQSIAEVRALLATPTSEKMPTTAPAAPSKSSTPGKKPENSGLSLVKFLIITVAIGIVSLILFVILINSCDDEKEPATYDEEWEVADTVAVWDENNNDEIDYDKQNRPSNDDILKEEADYEEVAALLGSMEEHVTENVDRGTYNSSGGFYVKGTRRSASPTVGNPTMLQKAVDLGKLQNGSVTESAQGVLVYDSYGYYFTEGIDEGLKTKIREINSSGDRIYDINLLNNTNYAIVWDRNFQICGHPQALYDKANAFWNEGKTIRSLCFNMGGSWWAVVNIGGTWAADESTSVLIEKASALYGEVVSVYVSDRGRAVCCENGVLCDNVPSSLFDQLKNLEFKPRYVKFTDDGKYILTNDLTQAFWCLL